MFNLTSGVALVTAAVTAVGLTMVATDTKARALDLSNPNDVFLLSRNSIAR